MTKHTPEHKAAARLERLRRRAPWAIGLGAALMLAGGAYGYWGTQQFTVPWHFSRPPAFDRPIARLGALVTAHLDELKARPVATELERDLRTQLVTVTEKLAALLLLLLRFMVASMLMTSGGLLLTSGLTRREIFTLLRAAEEKRGAR